MKMVSKNILFTLLLLLSCQFFGYSQITFGDFPKKDDGFALNYTYPEEYEIAEITVSGSKYLDKNAVIALTGLKAGDRIEVPGEKISKAVQQLWESGIIGDVSIATTKTEEKKIWLEIRLQERPRLTRVDFSGIKKSEENDLRENTGLIKGRIVTDAVIKNIKGAARKYFIDKGFLGVKTEITQIDDPISTNQSILKVNIEKGEKIRINYIIFEGNTVATASKLKGQMKNTKEKKRFDIVKDLFRRIAKKDSLKLWKSLKELSPGTIRKYVNDHVKLNIFASSKFMEKEYEADKDNVIAFLNSKGLRDATITYDTVYPYDKNSVNIEIEITEGRKYYYRDIEWTGNFVYDNKVLNEVLGIEKGDLYNPKELDKRLNFNMEGGLDVSSLYMDNGYLFFRIDPVEKLIEGDSIDLEMRVYEGPQADINKIIVEGNTVTNDRVVRRELRTYPGAKFSRTDIIRTQQSLSQLGYFDPEKIGINPEPVDQNGELVDIRYTLEEKSNDQLELSGGWGGSLGFIGTLGITFNNFSLRKLGKFKSEGIIPTGDGQRLSLRAQANGKAFQTYSMSFTEPWLGGRKRNSFSVSVSHSIQRIFANGTRESATGSSKIWAASLGLGRQLKWPDDYFTLSNSVSYLNYQFNDFFSALGFDNGTSNSVTFNTTLSRNSVDSPIFPRRGSQISLSLSLTPPYSTFSNRNYIDATPEEKFRWLEYHKWMFDGWWYLKIAGDLTLNMRAHMGFLAAYNKSVGIGPFERFVVGGNGLAGTGGLLLGQDIIGLRGYEDQLVGPQGPQGPSGGVVYNKFTMELRYPISLNPAATIYVLGFLEGGNNYGSMSEYNPFDLKRSVGLGARIFMPAFGLIGLDYGIGLDEIPGFPDASGGQFHFTIGQQLR